MAVITPIVVTATPKVQTCTVDTGIGRTISPEKNTNSQLLDNFLEYCTKIAPTHITPANAVPLKAINSTILTFPPSIIKRTLRNLLTSPHPLILQPDFVTTAQEYRNHVGPSVLQVCKIFHNIGVPILYGENTLRTSWPATSYDFDQHLLSLPGSKRQMITSVKLEIDWADQLWAKFPLVARALGELKALQKLELVIVEKEKENKMHKNRTALIEKDASLHIMITYGQTSPHEVKTAHPRPPAIDRAGARVKREGLVAALTLKAEMKMFKDLVNGMKGLRDFRLKGFRNEVFALRLEEHVRTRNH